MAALVAAGVVACATLPAPTRREYAISEPRVTCEDANRISFRATERLGYRISSFTPATAATAGVLKAERAAAIGKERVTVKIVCGGEGVSVDASEDNPFLASGDFRRAFHSVFTGMTEVGLRRQPEETAGQLRVKITPVRGLETKLEFGREVTGVFTVRVEIANGTQRAYVLEAKRVVVLTSSGERVAPLDDAGGAALPSRPLEDGVLEPGARATGYLYYPPGSYTGARGHLTEQESGEREGFSVQF